MNMIRAGILVSVVILVSPGSALAQEFLPTQLSYPRVREARLEKDSVLKAFCTARHLHYPPREIFLRAFKREAILEVWARDGASDPFVLLADYPVCQKSGELGPKRREGDRQVPEGFYHINDYNPVSDYHLSLGINYPNASDKILSDPQKPGGDIYIHGDCVTIGCIPIQDDPIREVYWLVVQVHAAGMGQIPVHIFPCRLDDAGMIFLKEESGDDKGQMAFWQSLRPGFEVFQKTKHLPVITVDEHGAYGVREK